MSTPLFLNGQRVPVYLEEDPDNIIYIKVRMTYGDEQRVTGGATRIKGTKTAEGGNQTEGNFDLGLYNLLFLQTNIVAWEGPLFEGVPCTPENIERFNPDHPLLDKVLSEINARNTGGGTSPNSSGSAGSTNSRATTKGKRRASGTPT